MADQAVLVERRDDAWFCALMTVHPVGPPSFGHYRSFTLPDVDAAVDAYRAEGFAAVDALVGVVGVHHGPSDWIYLSESQAITMGRAWDGETASPKIAGLAAELQTHLNATDRASGPTDVARLNDAWGGVGQDVAWMVDRNLQILHTQNIHWADRLSTMVKFVPGGDLRDVIRTAFAEGTLAPDVSPAVIFEKFAQGEAFEFERLGFAGLVITCACEPVGDAGYLVRETKQAVSTNDQETIDDVLVLTNTDEVRAASADPECRERVRLVCDDIKRRTVTKMLLETEGYVVAATDEDMPAEITLIEGTLGEGWCEKVAGDIQEWMFAQSPSHRFIIAVVPSVATENDILRLQMAGADGVIRSPFSVAALQAMISGCDHQAA